MFLHPVVAVFMVFWLSLVGYGALNMLSSTNPRVALFPAGMFVFGAALASVGFFPEAFKAKRLISAVLSDSMITPAQSIG